MALLLDGFRVKHLINVSEPLKLFCLCKNELQNGKFYILHIQNTIQYDALSRNNFLLYEKYVQETNQKEHSVDRFKKLVENFDISKIGKIKANIQAHSNFFWVADGAHRLAILKYKKIFGDTIPMKYVELNFFDCVQNKMKEMLKNTVEKSLENGWSNRTEFGYHSFDIYNIHIRGQRTPLQRFQKIKKYYDFTGKSVLDLGCNTGGMLFHIPEIAHGIGVDLDERCLESCRYFKKFLNYACKLDFFKADLNTFNVETFCEQMKFSPDIIFLLSIGSWVSNWRELYEACYKTTNTILLETNNDKEGYEQIMFFFNKCATITCVSTQSDDDCTGNLGRKTYLIRKNTTV
jgi:hypothetical protein